MALPCQAGFRLVVEGNFSRALPEIAIVDISQTFADPIIVNDTFPADQEGRRPQREVL